MDDYKPRMKRQGPGLGSTMVGVFIGLLLGLLIASAIAVYMMKSPLPFVSKSRAGDRASSAEQPPRQSIEGKAPSAVASAEAKGKREFTFHGILAGKEGSTAERVPETVTGAPVVATAPSQVPDTASNEAFVIQAGSFQNPADADNQKARLALLGLQASIEPAALPDKGTWYRVRLGPYRSPGEINAIQSQLKQAGINVTLLKVRN